MTKLSALAPAFLFPSHFLLDSLLSRSWHPSANRIPKFPQYKTAEKEPAKVQAALDEMEREEADEEGDEEYAG